MNGKFDKTIYKYYLFFSFFFKYIQFIVPTPDL